MKIKKNNFSFFNSSVTHGPKEIAKNGEFLSVFNKQKIEEEDFLSVENYEENLKDLLHLGDQLVGQFSFEKLNKYIQLFQIILKKLQHNYRLKVNHKKTLHEDKKYTLIIELDEKIKKFTDNLLKNQLSQMNVLNKLHVLQGILINLLR